MAVFFLALSIPFQTNAREPAPVIDATQVPLTRTEKESIEQRLEKIERRLDNRALIEVMSRLDQLQKEIQQLVGEIEVQTHNVDSMKKRQRELYLDIDRRLQQSEKMIKDLAVEQRNLDGKISTLKKSPGPVAIRPTPTPAPPPAAKKPEPRPVQPVPVPLPVPAPVTPAPVTKPVASAPVPQSVPAPVKPSPSTTAAAAPTAAPASSSELQLEREAYNRAFNLLKDGRFDLAIASFKAFIETYPNARDSDDAQYWMGDANYAQGRYDAAIVELQKVLDSYPNSSKRPDALLRMGYTYEMKGDSPKAIEYLERVTKEFPSSTAAHLATKRIQALKRK